MAAAGHPQKKDSSLEELLSDITSESYSHKTSLDDIFSDLTSERAPSPNPSQRMATSSPSSSHCVSPDSTGSILSSRSQHSSCASTLSSPNWVPSFMTVSGPTVHNSFSMNSPPLSFHADHNMYSCFNTITAQNTTHSHSHNTMNNNDIHNSTFVSSNDNNLSVSNNLRDQSHILQRTGGDFLSFGASPNQNIRSILSSHGQNVSVSTPSALMYSNRSDYSARSFLESDQTNNLNGVLDTSTPRISLSLLPFNSSSTQAVSTPWAPNLVTQSTFRTTEIDQATPNSFQNNNKSDRNSIAGTCTNVNENHSDVNSSGNGIHISCLENEGNLLDPDGNSNPSSLPRTQEARDNTRQPLTSINNDNNNIGSLVSPRTSGTRHASSLKSFHERSIDNLQACSDSILRLQNEYIDLARQIQTPRDPNDGSRNGRLNELSLQESSEKVVGNRSYHMNVMDIQSNNRTLHHRESSEYSDQPRESINYKSSEGDGDVDGTTSIQHGQSTLNEKSNATELKVSKI